MSQISDLFEKVKSGVISINYVLNQNRISSGSGFYSNGFLITNNHVFIGPDNCDVILRFFDSDPSDIYDGIKLSYSEFQNSLKVGSTENNYDYAVLEISELSKRNPYNFELGDFSNDNIGDDIVFLGYPFEHLNLVCHKGIISSLFKSGIVDIIQIDASVNNSNSGGPILSLKDEKVIGIITRKATGLTNAFNELANTINQNINVLKKSKSILSMGGVDPIDALIVSQNQIGTISKEIERSANVGIGYGFSINHLKQENIFD